MSDDENSVLQPELNAEGVVPPPSGAGVRLSPRPSMVRQFAFSAVGAVGFSLFAVFEWWLRRLATTPGALVLTFFVTLGVLTLVWLTVLGARTLDRRRLMRLFPGTLVFSFAQTREIVNGLRQLGGFEPGRNDFDLGRFRPLQTCAG